MQHQSAMYAAGAAGNEFTPYSLQMQQRQQQHQQQQQQHQQQQQQHQVILRRGTPAMTPEMREMLASIQNLYRPETREKAILDLSKNREKYTYLGPTLWYSVGIVPIILQEILSMYSLLHLPPNVPAKAAINRVSSVLTLVQAIAHHEASRKPFLDSQFCLFLYPFLRVPANERTEVLRLTSLGVIGALVKSDDPQVITYLLSTEIFPLCLRIMEQALEISKIISTFIVQKILLSDQGLQYACQSPKRFAAVAEVLRQMLSEKNEEGQHVCGARLLRHIIRCYLRLSEHERVREALPKMLPEELRNNTFHQTLENDTSMKKWLLQLLVNIGDEGAKRISEGLPSSWNESVLRERYSEFGEIVSTKVVPSRHFGFVMFRRPDSAHKAINATHLTKPMESTSNILHVSIAMHDEGVDEIPNERIFVRGLPQWATKEHLRQRFSTFGTIVDCAVLMNPLGQCKGSGFVHFSSVDEATSALKDSKSLRIDGCDNTLEVKFSETREVRQQRQERNRHRQRNWGTTPKYYGSEKSPFPGGVVGGSGSGSVGAFGLQSAVNPSFILDPYLNFSAPPLAGDGRASCVAGENVLTLGTLDNIHAGRNRTMVPSIGSPIQLAHISSSVTPSFVPSPVGAVYPNHAVPLLSPSQGGVGGYNLITTPVPFPMMYPLPAVPVATASLPSPQPTQIVYPSHLVSSSIVTTGGGLYANSPIYVVNKPALPQKGDLNFSGAALSEEVLRVLLEPYGPIDEMLVIVGSGDIAVRMKDTNQHALIAQHLNGTTFYNGQLLAVGLYA